MRIHLQALTKVLLIAVLLVSPMTAAQAAATDVVIEDYTLVSKSRVSRFAYQFVYRGRAINTGDALADVQATLATPLPAGMTPIDDVLDLGDMGAGAGASAEFSFRQDRRFPLNEADLVWDISADVGAVYLDGDPGSPAVDAVVNFDSGDVIDPSEISDEAGRSQIVRTKLLIAFERTATVAQVNDLLASIGASITGMLEGVAQVIVRIPDPGSLAAVDALEASLAADSRVRYVVKGYVAQPATGTAAVTLPADQDATKHHLALAGHAAWNASFALVYDDADPPLLVIGDFFGDGAPNADFAVQAPLGKDLSKDFGSGKPNAHGHHVLGIIAGRHGDEASTQRSLVKGIYPESLDLRVVDLTSLTDHSTVDLRLILAVVTGEENAVISTSLGDDNGKLDYLANIPKRARAWIEMVREYATENLENRARCHRRVRLRRFG